jgi:alcohol dehydrogenase (NADP+)
VIETKGYATHDPNAKFVTYDFERRDLGDNDILIDIEFCGICHSDIHQAKNEWNDTMPTTYPLVPGHEIVGRVSKVGNSVTKFEVGDIAGIGCFVDSCRVCPNCKAGLEQFCVKQAAFTYNGTEMDRITRTYGGYSDKYVIDEAYALKVRSDQNLAGVAPLMCAGITTFSPLRRFNVGPGQKVGIVGLGGLGHMGVKLAAAMGAEVTVFSTSPGKEADARALGAQNFVVTRDPANLVPLEGKFNFILDTVSADHDVSVYLRMLGIRGVMVVVGVPEAPAAIHSTSLIFGNKSLAGSLIGGIPETQEMLDFCAEHNLTADVEVITPDRIEEAYDRTVRGDVHYRFVIDASNI